MAARPPRPVNPLLWTVPALLIAGVATPTDAFSPQVTFEPENPTSVGTVAVSVETTFPNGCWWITGSDCAVSVTDRSVTIRIDTVDLSFEINCTTAVATSTLHFELGRLLPGSYRLEITEYHDSPRYWWPERVGIDFEVSEPTPVEEITWGRIKSLYDQ